MSEYEPLIKDTNPMLYIGDKPIGYASEVKLIHSGHSVELYSKSLSLMMDVPTPPFEFVRKLFGVNRGERVVNRERYTRLAWSATSIRKTKKYLKILGFKLRKEVTNDTE